jgi:hypothetical protein
VVMVIGSDAISTHGCASARGAWNAPTVRDASKTMALVFIVDTPVHTERSIYKPTRQSAHFNVVENKRLKISRQADTSAVGL